MDNTQLEKFFAEQAAQQGQAAAPAPAPAQPQAPAPAQPQAPAPAQVPGTGPSGKPYAPAEVVNLLVNPPGGADPAAFRAQFEQQFDLSNVPAPAQPQAPAPAVAPQPVAMPQPVPPRTSDGQPPSGSPPAPAQPGQELAPRRMGGAPTKAAKGISKADRLKLACAALQGGTITLAEAERYYDPKAGAE